MSLILTIGRNTDNDIVLSMGYISGYHAQLIFNDDGGWFIHDLQSANGTYVNGIRINSPVQVNQDDEVILGGSILPLKGLIEQHGKKEVLAPIKHPVVIHYLLALAAVLILFSSFYLVNEWVAGRYAGTGLTDSGSSTGNNKEEGIKKETKKEIVYDFSCVNYSDNTSVDRIAARLDSIETAYINKSGVQVSLQEEIEFGDQNHEQLMKGSAVVNNDQSARLKAILEKLVGNVPHPRGFNYKFFLLDSDEINAWTSGGRIYFTTAMLQFTQNETEAAGIIAHEINHNELFHITDKLKANKLAIEKLGDKTGNTVGMINKVLTSPFGKRDEVHCDLVGTDLLIASGFDPCLELELWKRMAANEGEYDQVKNFLRSHPHSGIRVNCIQHHLSTNYNIECK
ncbi:MAG: FHA domain-containing protein [Chitinophagaceae bacterium]